MLSKKDEGAPRPALELNPDLAALGGAAAAVDADTAFTEIPNEPGQVEEGTNYVLEAQDMLNTAGGLVVSYCPEAAPLWQPAITAHCAQSLAPVLEKYNVTLAKLPVELAAIIALGPLLWQTAQLVAAKIRRDREAAQPAHAAPTAQAASGASAQRDAEAPVSTMPQMDLYKDSNGNLMQNFPDM